MAASAGAGAPFCCCCGLREGESESGSSQISKETAAAAGHDGMAWRWAGGLDRAVDKQGILHPVAAILDVLEQMLTQSMKLIQRRKREGLTVTITREPPTTIHA